MDTAIAQSLLLSVITFADVLALGIASVLFVKNVLHWKMKGDRRTYISVAVLSLLCAACICVLNIWGSYQKIEMRELNINLFYPLFVLCLLTLLTIQTDGRVWKKLIVTFFAMSIVTNLQTRFSYIPDYLELNKQGFLSASLINALSSLLVLLFVWLLSRISRKQVNRPVRVSTVAILGMLLFIFDEIVLSTFRVVPTESNAIPLDLTIYFTKPDSPEAVIFYLVINILLYIAALILAFFIFAQKSENNYYKKMVDANAKFLTSQAQYYEAVEQSNKDIRKIRHDMRNHLTVLSLLLENREYDRMRTYLDEICDTVQSTDAGLHNGNTIADVILYDKSQKATEAGCSITVDGRFTYTGMTAIDTCAILGNILDNAIEATSQLPSDRREIRLTFLKTENYFLIRETNPCRKLIITDNNILATGKLDKKNHGFGLLNIREAAARYQGDMQISCEKRDEDPGGEDGRDGGEEGDRFFGEELSQACGKSGREIDQVCRKNGEDCRKRGEEILRDSRKDGEDLYRFNIEIMIPLDAIFEK